MLSCQSVCSRPHQKTSSKRAFVTKCGIYHNCLKMRMLTMTRISNLCCSVPQMILGDLDGVLTNGLRRVTRTPKIRCMRAISSDSAHWAYSYTYYDRFGTAIWDCDEPIYAGALFILALALADGALFGFTHPEEVSEQRIPPGKMSWYSRGRTRRETDVSSEASQLKGSVKIR